MNKNLMYLIITVIAVVVATLLSKNDSSTRLQQEPPLKNGALPINGLFTGKAPQPDTIEEAVKPTSASR